MSTPPAPVYIPQPNLQHRPIALLDAQGRLNINFYSQLAFRGDDNSGTTLIYKGWARPGSATSAAVWQIQKLAYDASGNVTSITWPQVNSIASNDFQFIWDNRASYTYS
jgi:YD repeat-containing protein